MKQETSYVDLDTILASGDPPRSGWVKFGRGVGALVAAACTVAACGTYVWGMNELFNQRKHFERIGEELLDPTPLPSTSLVPTIDPAYVDPSPSPAGEGTPTPLPYPTKAAEDNANLWTDILEKCAAQKKC